MKLKMIIHKTGWVVEVMATAGGYAMVRRSGALPTVMGIKELRYPLPDEISDGTMKVLGNVKRS
jgi:hypothetical protein